MDKNYDIITFISKYLYFKKAWRSRFSDIIKILTMFIKANFEDSEKVKRIRNYVSKCDLYLYSLIYSKIADFWWKNADFSRNQEVCYVI